MEKHLHQECSHEHHHEHHHTCSCEHSHEHKEIQVHKKMEKLYIQQPTLLIGHPIYTIKRVTNIRIGSIFQHHAVLVAETQSSAL